MKDLQNHRDILLREAEECRLISHLAADAPKPRVVREARATPPDVGGRDPERNWKSGTKQSSSSCRPGLRVKARPVKPGPGDGRTAFAIHVSLARRKSRIRLTRSSSRSRGFLPWKALIKFQNWSRTAIWENADVLLGSSTLRGGGFADQQPLTRAAGLRYSAGLGSCQRR